MSEKLFESSFFAFMKTQATLTAKISERIFPLGGTPQGAPFPYMTWQIIDNLHVHSQAGPSGLANPRLQIDAWAETQFAASELAKIIRLILDGFKGTMGEPGNETKVRLISIDNDEQQFTPPNDATQTGAYRSQADYLVWYETEV